MIYQWASGSRVRARAQEVGERLEVLRGEQGQLTAEIVVIDARPETSPLHSAFTWDDAVAAQSWREVQARHLLKALMVTVEGRAEPTRAFIVGGENPDDGQRSYKTVARVMGDAELRRQALAAALRELRAFRAKYEELQELAGILAEIRLLVPA